MKKSILILAAVILIILAGLQIKSYLYKNSKKPTSSLSEINSQKPSEILPKTKLVFDQQNIVTIKVFSRGQKLYYIKNGDIWSVDLSNTQANSKTIINKQENIISFDVSTDGAYIVYSTIQNKTDDIYGMFNQNADSIFVVNTKNSSETMIYTGNKDSQRIQNILFLKNSTRFTFANDAIWMVDAATDKIQRIYYKPVDNDAYFYYYWIQGISSDGRNILANLARVDGEGGRQIIVDAVSRKLKSTIDNGYVYGGTTMLGFINNSLLLGYNNELLEEPADNNSWPKKLGTYTLTAKLLKNITQDNQIYNIFFSNSQPNKTLVGLNQNKSSFELDFFDFDQQKQILIKSITPTDMVTVLNDGSIWITNTNFENAKYIDTGSDLRIK